MRVCVKIEVKIPSNELTGIQTGCVLPFGGLRICFSALNFRRTILSYQNKIHRTKLKISIYWGTKARKKHCDIAQF